MFLWLTLLVSVVWLVVFRYRRRRMYKLAESIPDSEQDIPIIGLAHMLTGSTEDFMTKLKEFSYIAMRSGGMIKGWMAHMLYVIQVDPADVEVVLKTCLEKDDLHRFLRKLHGNGGVFAPVPIWRVRRKILVPAFSPKIVESFVEVFSEQSQKLASLLHSHANKQQFRIWPLVSSYTLDSVLETTLGVKINAQGNSGDVPFVRAMISLFQIISERTFRLWLQPDWLFRLFRRKYTEQQRCIQLMHGFTDDVIRKKREEIKHKPEQFDADLDPENILVGYQRKSFLDHLITLSGGDKGYDDVELREEVITLITAGTDTSATTIGYTLKLLAKYPDVQEKVYQELLDVFGDSDRPLVKDDLASLKYLERVVKESLRLYPPGPFIMRKVLEDTKLPSGHTLPAGSGVLVSIWGLHRDPKYWGPDAEHFDPDRFLPERFNVPPGSYIPFSSGPRNCVGFRVAFISVKSGLSSILRKYRVVGDKETSAVPNIRTELAVMMKAVDGFKVALEPRKPETVSNGHHI